MSGDPDVKFNGISTINISAAHISLSSLNTYALLAQVVDAPINGSNIIVQTLPWDRMKLDGDVYLNSGTWQHGGKLKISSLSTITRLWGSSINASEIYANSANLGGVRATTVSTFYMSTFGADLRGFTFNEGAGNYLSVGILSVGVAQFSTLTFTDFLANFISTSSILGNSGLFSNVTTSTVTFWDTLYRTYNALEFRGGNFYINGLTPVLSNVIRDFQLLSTTAGLYTLNDTTSNALQSDITTLSNTFDIASSNLSTNTGSTFSTLQKAISTSSSNLMYSVLFDLLLLL
jgi:hypothetical protein